MAWTDTSRGQDDIYVGSSDNGAKTWSNPVVRVPTTTAGQHTSLKPHLAVDPSSKNAYLVWPDYRNGVYADLYFSVSLDQGSTWNKPDYRLDEASPGKARATGPRILVASSRVAVVWTDYRVQTAGGLDTGPNGDIYCTYLEN